MNTIEKIGEVVRTRIDRLGERIWRLAEEEHDISGQKELSETEKAERISSARTVVMEEMDTAFGEDEGSIRAQVYQLVEAPAEPVARERSRVAAEIWLRELPALRQYLEYCSELIQSHPGELSKEVREGHKCLAEAVLVHETISSRVERELAD